MYKYDEDNAIFIAPNNELITLKVYEVNEYCKQLCYLPENIDKFREFEKGYTKFDAYFDFVVFELNYIYSFNNRWFASTTHPLYDDVALYEIKGLFEEDINYQTIKNKLESSNKTDSRFMPSIVKCSDYELQIKKLNEGEEQESFWDWELNTYSNRTGKILHELLALTIVNQFITKNKEIFLDFKEFLKDAETYYSHYEGDRVVILYLMQRFGFIRVASPLIVYYKSEKMPKELSTILFNYPENVADAEVCSQQPIFECIYFEYKNRLLKNDEERTEEIKISR